MKSFSLGKQQRLQALNQVSFQVARGTTHALVGESGSAKPRWRASLWGF
ncbi:dipeptide transporter ATP-binding subunit [Pantoea agglomerans]|uniref:Dipeptide transporter ATP-binding subunit n=1 Tax=Enterobacter agglomerans TaxID=549 RepID=A0A379LS13_ENTAG|nr:dipeptide transporter ATP-binding subunit [Pantoea agglomerans]